MVKEKIEDFGEFIKGEDVLEPEEKVEEEDDDEVVLEGENYVYLNLYFNLLNII